MENQGNKQEIEIDIWQILSELLRKAWFVVLLTVVAAVAALLISMFVIKPVYQSSTKVFILNKQLTAVSAADFQTATQLTSDYEQLIKSRYVMDTVIAEMGLKMDAAALSASISVTSVVNTRILQIMVSNVDPHIAQQVADKVRDVSSKQIVEIMNIDAVNLVDEANLPLVASSPSVSRNTLLGAMIGFVLSCVVIVLMCVLNDTIRTPADIEKYLELSILGVVPLLDEDVKKSKLEKPSPQNRVKGKGH